MARLLAFAMLVICPLVAYGQDDPDRFVQTFDPAQRQPIACQAENAEVASDEESVQRSESEIARAKADSSAYFRAYKKAYYQKIIELEAVNSALQQSKRQPRPVPPRLSDEELMKLPDFQEGKRWISDREGRATSEKSRWVSAAEMARVSLAACQQRAATEQQARDTELAIRKKEAADKAAALEAQRRDPRAMRPVISAGICVLDGAKAVYIAEIDAEKKYARKYSGVVDMAKLHQLGMTIRAIDESEDGLRGALQEMKVQALGCGNSLVSKLAKCISYPGREMPQAKCTDPEVAHGVELLPQVSWEDAL